MNEHARISRRDMLLGWFEQPRQRLRGGAENDQVPRVAVIQGRHCLAYRSLSCSTCYERCPEAGAITMQQGVPRVELDVCTGCGVCKDVCPAPKNAVLMVTARTPKATPS